MKGYKVFNSDWSCRGKQYSCPGIFEQEGELRLCENGIHFCKELSECFNYYKFNPKNKVAEIETIGTVIEDVIGKKYCTSKIKIIKELSWYEVLDLVNIYENNTNFNNSGYCNSDDYKLLVKRSSDNHNTDDLNSGDYDPGSYKIPIVIISMIMIAVMDILIILAHR